jgi:hypothetical protein
MIGVWQFKECVCVTQLFVFEVCWEENWKRPVLPAIAWREMAAFGSQRLLIGGPNEFEEYCLIYYGVELNKSSCELVKIASENLAAKVEVVVFTVYTLNPTYDLEFICRYKS